jgi:DNA-binding NtrC family response regulator
MARLLIIDDDRACRESLARVLADAGHSVTLLSNGARVLESFAAEEFDAVLTDIYMPECDGIETAARLHSVQPHIPIIAMMGDAGTANDPVRHAMQMFGAVAILEKPLDTGRLLSTIESAIAARESRHAAGDEEAARIRVWNGGARQLFSRAADKVIGLSLALVPALRNVA